MFHNIIYIYIYSIIMFHNVSSPAVKVLWGSRLSRSIEFLWYRRILRMTMRHVHHIFMSQFNIFIMHAMHVISRHSTELWLVSESNPAWSHPATHPDPCASGALLSGHGSCGQGDVEERTVPTDEGPDFYDGFPIVMANPPKYRWMVYFIYWKIMKIRISNGW